MARTRSFGLALPVPSRWPTIALDPPCAGVWRQLADVVKKVVELFYRWVLAAATSATSRVGSFAPITPLPLLHTYTVPPSPPPPPARPPAPLTYFPSLPLSLSRSLPPSLPLPQPSQEAVRRPATDQVPARPRPNAPAGQTVHVRVLVRAGGVGAGGGTECGERSD